MYSYKEQDHVIRKQDTKSKDYIKIVINVVKNVGRDFCNETTMHGFNHIAAEKRLWIERLLWIAATMLACWGTIEVSLGQLQRYNESPTVTTMEKDYRDWRYSYPALTVCYGNRVDAVKLPKVLRSFWNATPGDTKYEYYESFVRTVANSDLFHLEGYEEFKGDTSLNVDLVKLVYEVMPDLHMKATWSTGVSPLWYPVMTENGACYVTNCVACSDEYLVKVNLNETKLLPLSCQYASFNCYVMLEDTAVAYVYPHSPYNVVELTMHRTHIYPSLNKLTDYSVTGTNCGQGVRELTLQRRGCRYTDEPVQVNRTVYSTNTCRLSCRSNLAVKKCGCKPFYYFYNTKQPTCDTAGMACLAVHAQALASNGGERCNCAQQCVDAVFKELSFDDQHWTGGALKERGAVKYTIQAPRTRYTREIVFHFQDLVVSFGGAAGLFLGASFISIVEIFYFVAARALNACIGDGGRDKVVDVRAKKPAASRISYEERRIQDLDRILDDQRKYGYLKTYPY